VLAVDHLEVVHVQQAPWDPRNQPAAPELFDVEHVAPACEAILDRPPDAIGLQDFAERTPQAAELPADRVTRNRHAMKGDVEAAGAVHLGEGALRLLDARVGFLSGAYQSDPVSAPHQLANQNIRPLGGGVPERMRARRRDQDDRQPIAFRSAAMRLRLVTYRNTVDVIDREAIALAPEEWRVEKQCASASVACQGTSVMNFRDVIVTLTSSATLGKPITPTRNVLCRAE
jgi:hypothetical protein